MELKCELRPFFCELQPLTCELRPVNCELQPINRELRPFAKIQTNNNRQVPILELNKQASQQQELGLNWKPIVGFILSIILTAFALWAALYSGYSPKILFFSLSIVAFTQAVLQLFKCDA